MVETRNDTAPLAVLDGVTGQVELYVDRVVIRKKGWFARLVQHFPGKETTLYFHEIKDVNYHGGEFMVEGFIKFVINRQEEQPIIVIYSSKLTPQAAKIKAELDDRISRYRLFPEMRAVFNKL